MNSMMGLERSVMGFEWGRPAIYFKVDMIIDLRNWTIVFKVKEPHTVTKIT